jgi:hypothetical protein
MLLHEAIVKVLRENKSKMTIQEIADEIHKRELCKKKDGGVVELRPKKRPQLFTVNGSSVGLVEWNQSPPRRRTNKINAEKNTVKPKRRGEKQKIP